MVPAAVAKKPKPKPDPLVGAIERSIQAVLKDRNATAAAKAKARADAIRLLEVKHKIAEERDDGGHFFDRD